ncbi:hypothetical protein GCM10009844_13940 [Nocardioides koreensis]|uniref:Phosphatidic acid phosphatase type 2/haloperoxidase domain-containing protein n=1 Tax=Nocardioides koreensis TaxID=433651 RepID=A0ABN2ZI42_9ACTN
MIDSVASHILALPIWVALLVVFAMPALESSAFVGFVFPGEVALILGGVLAAEGHASLAAVLVAAIAGAIVGDSVGYLVGRRYGRRLLQGVLGRFVRHEHLDRAERYIADRGGKAVFLGRFTAALRVMIPGLAGMSRMHYPTFAVYNVAGGAAWATMSVLLGYVGGSSWQQVAQLASRIGLGALALVLAGAATGLVVRRRHSGWARRQRDRLVASRPVVRLAARFPRTTTWVGRRLDPATGGGLPLTAVVATGAGSTWLFLGITQDVVAREELTSLDPRVHAWVLDHRLAWLDRLMQAATWLGSNAVLVPLLLLAGLALWRARRTWTPLAWITIVYGAALLARAVVGEAVHRHRPPAADWLAAASGWSYPSGHTLQATAAYGVLVVLLASGRAARTRALLAGGAALVVAVVAASRVYLGMHWLTDVLGSVTLGVALLCWWWVARSWLRSGPAVDAAAPAVPDEDPAGWGPSRRRR